MKKVNTSLIIIFLIVIGFTSCKQSDTPGDGLIKVDVTKTYSSKKELILQDFMDVEYVALETNNDFLNEGFVQDIGSEVIIVKNWKHDGDIFIYDRTGKALRKINRKGQGGGEYINILRIALDEDNKEIFVNDHFTKRVQVYDLHGNFKRSFKHQGGVGDVFYTEIFNYDRDHLICYGQYRKEIPFVLISKQDGNIIKDIEIPFEKKVLLQQELKDGETTYGVNSGPYRAIIPFKGDWLLMELSSDTIYSFQPDYSLRPFLVRIPPIQSMDPGIFLMLRFFSDRYIFMETVKNVYDWDSQKGFPRTFMMYDKQEKVFGGYTVYNGDYTTKQEIYMNQLMPVNHEIESWQALEAHQLVEDYKEGRLKGKLKEIASTLNEEDNPVIMLVKHKK